MSDQQALDAYSFDLRWRHGLGVHDEDNEGHTTRRTLVEFRRRLVQVDPEGTLLRRVFAPHFRGGCKRANTVDGATAGRFDACVLQYGQARSAESDARNASGVYSVVERSAARDLAGRGPSVASGRHRYRQPRAARRKTRSGSHRRQAQRLRANVARSNAKNQRSPPKKRRGFGHRTIPTQASDTRVSATTSK